MRKRSDSEIKKTLRLLADQRYRYSLLEILKDQQVVVLEKEEGAYAISNFEEQTLLSIWPAVVYAQKSVSGEWKDFSPKIIALSKLEGLLEFVDDQGWALDMFPVGGKTGSLVTVDEFINDLNKASGKS